MAPLPVIPLAYRCALNWTEGTGLSAVNVIHLLAADAETPADVFNGLEDCVTHDMWGVVSGFWRVGSVDITPLDGTTATASFATTTADDRWAGSAAGDTIIQVACVVKLTTPTRGRSARGRLFLPSPAESAYANGFFDPTGIASMQAAWNTFLAALPGFSKELVVASYALAEANPVTGILVEAAAGTQRRRQQRLRV